MFETIITAISVICLLIAVPFCIAVSDKYISDRNLFRDQWLEAVEEFNRHLIDENYDLKNEIDELKTKDNKENNDAEN